MEIKFLTDRFELWKGANGFTNIPHEHDDWYQITLPVEGTCHLLQENKSYQLGAGSGILQHPRTEHSFHIGTDSAVIAIKFRNQLLDNLELSKQDFLLEPVFDPGEITALFRSWSSEMLANGSESLLMQQIESQVQLYLLHLLKPVGKPVSWSGLEDNTLPVNSESYLRRVLDYVHSCYATSVDIDSMAAIAMQSRYHFIRSFKELTGTTPYQYVLRLRVEDAARRLRQSTDSVMEISFGLGFSSVSQLNRTFLRLKGMTPSQFRNSRDA